MTRQEIEAVFERVKTWPEDRQAWAAEMLLDLEKTHEEQCELSDEDMRALDQAIAEADRGEFATDVEVGAVFDRERA